MKKIFIVLAVVIVLVVGAAAVFAATFNLDNYRPMIVENASKALGTPVDIGRLSLAWRNGLAVRAQDLIVYSNAAKSSASAKIKEVSAAVKLLPLLNKRVEITSIVLLSPQLHVVKLPGGKTGLKGVELPAPGAAASSVEASAVSPGVPLELSVRLFQMRDGAVWFEDISSAPAVSVMVKDIDVDVKDFSLSDAFSFHTKAALFSAGQNLDASGTLMLPLGDNTGLLEDGVFKTDLSQLDLAELSRSFPAARQAGIQEIKGVLETKIDRLELGGSAAADVDLTLKDARVKMSASKSAMDDVQLKAALRGEDLRVENFSADYAGGRIKANGIVKKFKTQALSGFTLKSNDLSLEQMMPETRAGGPKLSGRLSMDLEGQAAGTGWPQISQTLNGQGQVSLKEGVLLNYNLLRTVIEKLSMVPGADQMLRDNLPNIYKAKMNEPSTILQPIQVPFTVQNGQILMNDLELVTDFIIIRGAGQIGFDKRIYMKTSVRLHQQLSQTIVQLVPQAQMVTNSIGEIELPGVLQGTLPHVTFVPDPEYIAQKLLTSEAAQKVIKGFIENPEAGIGQVRNLLDKPVQAGESGVKNSVAGLLGSEDSLKNLLQQAIGGDSQADSSGTGTQQ